MWAFVGAGASMDAGLPSWPGLLWRVAVRLGMKVALEEPGLLRGAVETGAYARAFGLVEEAVGREVLVGAVRDELAGAEPGPVLKALADLPFAGYVTTNYDGLLLNALRQAGRRPAPWTRVGNTALEARKVTGDAENVVWHVHGSLDLPLERSRLVLTQDDYDEVYQGGAVDTLRGLVEQRRVVFAGFGFADHDVRWLLKTVRRRTAPERPVFAFLSGTSPSDREALRLEQNVSVIPYHVLDDGSHRRLTELLRVYASMTLARSLDLARGRKERPGFDPATTGLLLYNELVLSQGTELGGEVLDVLVRTRVLALLAEADAPFDSLAEDVSESVGQVGAVDRTELVRQAVGTALDELEAEGQVERRGGGHGLTAVGERTVGKQAGRARAMDDQFRESLRLRAIDLMASEDRAETVTDAAHAFISDCLSRRALGLALAVDRWDAEHQRYHMVSLLQTLPDHAESLGDDGEVIALVEVVRGFIEAPTKVEETFVGVVLQARFAGHLMGYDAESLAARVEDVRRTAFVVDSNTLIPFLSVGSGEHAAAQLLMDQLKDLGSMAVTTTAMSKEVARHANWAIDRVDPDGVPAERALMASVGASGERGNQFLDGFIAERAAGRARDFFDYLRTTCGLPMEGRRVTATEVTACLADRGVRSLDFVDEVGGDESAFDEVEGMEAQIAKERIGSDTYTGIHQTTAEARVAWLVRGLRNGTVPIEGLDTDNAFFVSPSRAVNRAVPAGGRPVTMHPEALRQWVTTLLPRPESELRAFIGCMQSELAERGLAVVDRDRLRRAFGPTIQASRESYERVMAAYRDRSAQRYGAEAFEALDPVRQPEVTLATATQAALESKEEAERQRQRALAAAKTEKLNSEDARDLARLRAEKDERRRRRKKRK